MEKELIVIDNELVKKEISPADVFVPGGLDVLIYEISAKAKDEVAGLDPSTDKGRKAYGSVCRKISSSKVFVSGSMKNYVADLKNKIKPVDGERIRWEKEMDALNEEIDKPRQEWIFNEAKKVKAAEDIIRQINAAMQILSGTTSAELARRIEIVENLEIDNLPGDYADSASKLRDDALTKLYSEQAAVEKREAEAAELAKLRAESEARAEADRKAKEAAEREEREKRLKAEAAETARREAEEKAAAEIRKAKEAQEAAERREKEAEAKRIADTEAARVAAIKAQEEAAAKAVRDAEEAFRKEKEAQKEAAAKAKEEADRKESERLAEVERQRVAEEKRIANKKHRAKVRETAVKAISAIPGINWETAEAIFDAISADAVPHVTVNY